MKPSPISRSSMTINSIWKVRGRRPTLRRTCKVFIPRDLRELDTLRLPATYEEDSFIVQKLKTFTKHKMHHLILVIAIALYLYAGALLFQFLDSQCKEVNLLNVTELRDKVVHEIFNTSKNMNEDESAWSSEVISTLEVYESKLFDNWDAGYGADMVSRERKGLSIEASVFYCFTIITTIGYGNIVPCNDLSRGVTTMYAIIGVPLMILVLADLGKLFTKVMKFIVCTLKRFYKTGTFKLMKTSLITDNKPLQYMTVSWRTVNPEKTFEELDDPRKSVSSYGQSNQVTTLTIHNDDLYKNLDFLNPDEKNHKHVEVKDDFYLPVSLAVFLVIVYMVAGGLLFSTWENWTFFEALYFVFISMTTIGFGDYVPQHEEHMVEAFSYLVLGLMLTSMCINVISEKLTVTFQKTSVRIGNNTVLNVGSLLQDEDHRSRALQTGISNLHDYDNILGCKMTIYRNSLTVNSMSQMQIKPYVKITPNLSDDATKNEFILRVPSQNRFTFYDSPYNTIQDNDNTLIS